MMDLKTFVEETLCQIAGGIQGAQEREAYYAFQGMYQTAVDNMYAATHALDTCLKLRTMYPIRG